MVDKWAESAVKAGDSATARLITFDEVHTFGYGDESIDCGPNCQLYSKPADLPIWIYNDNYTYWTMSELSSDVWDVGRSGQLFLCTELSGELAVRPVLEISKSADLTKLES